MTERCWFCDGSAVAGSTVYAEVTVGAASQPEVGIPRCRSCARWHLINLIYAPIFLVILIPLIVVVLIMLTGALTGEPGMRAGLAMTGGLLAGMVAFKVYAGKRPPRALEYWHQHPAIAELPAGSGANLPGARRKLLVFGVLLLLTGGAILYGGLSGGSGHDKDATYVKKTRDGRIVDVASGAEREKERKTIVVVIGVGLIVVGLGLSIVGGSPRKRAAKPA